MEKHGGGAQIPRELEREAFENKEIHAVIAYAPNECAGLGSLGWVI